MYPSVRPREYAKSKYSPERVRPVPTDAEAVKVPYEPYPRSTDAYGSAPTEAVLMFMLAPKAPGPAADVPRPRWSCTLESMPESAGMFTQKTS